jgi:hypothetical protein
MPRSAAINSADSGEIAMCDNIENLYAISRQTLVTIAAVPVRVGAHDLAVLQRSAAGEDVDLTQLAAAHEAIG